MIRKLLVLLLTLFVLAAIALGLIAWKQHAALEQPLAVTDEPLLLDVRPGDTPSGVFQRLEADGVLEDAFWLRLYWRLNLSGQSLHSGEYRLAPGMTARDMIGLWQRGEVVQYSLTLVEGWNFRQLRIALQNQPKLEQTLGGLSDAEIMAKLDAPELHPEGRFFPDTYRFTRGTSDLDLLRRAFARLEQVLEEEWQQRAQGLPYNDAYQALIMASIIEKETGVPEERGEISGVFVRRLARGMLLQTDPTVIYGMGEAYRGRITRNDLRTPTPYNTYTNAGLPPTPIAMVGREAIRAALHPVDGSSLYFVARGDGSHVFSDTLEQHNRAVREYQLKRRADYRSSPPRRQAPVNSENAQ
ncbi:endolytic transglycosylase MltG [Stutzerimonas frequens]|uniref:Endolytic murein transglycosylase n=1 Tax=Stutzerimonas frequens TaxID=2968969 RepID=A0ABX6XT29_9GAMM|nr:endolytic transglycosylase MltG [Stutzerimonas frequens]MCQ4303074.1 endolytic transglycosylase MltG [Stutzerimonas frequens]PNF50862.1 endolytic transglycosylase MltG [Stutzerimonas frequens]QPT17178.1 endolytic transglycosylase MltG [Stutzerimonas frequens]